MRQILVVSFSLVFILIAQSCSPNTELSPIPYSKKRIPKWINTLPSDFENWYEVGQTSINDSIKPEDYALGLMNEKLRINLEKILITSFELDKQYLDKITENIISRRQAIINSLKKIDSSFVNNGIKYVLLKINKKDYHDKIAKRYSNNNVEEKFLLLNEDITNNNFSILSSIIENVIIHFDHILINNNKNNIGSNIFVKIRERLDDYSNRITFLVQPAIINSLPIMNEGESIVIGFYDNKSTEKLESISVIQDYGNTFDLIKSVISSSQLHKIKFPSTNDGSPYSLTIKIDYETILNTPYFDLFLSNLKEFKIAVITNEKKVFLHETIGSLNSKLGKTVFNDSMKSCFESNYQMIFVNDVMDADLSMYFEVSSNENVIRKNRKQPFKSEAFFIVKIKDSKTRKIMLDHIVASQQALHNDFIERASIEALKKLAHEALSVICF